jgi:uroporphyrinogen decarboxylase
MRNDRILKALNGQPTDTTPMWMMRQAGRYLPEFRAARAKMPDFMQFCKIPDYAAEVTLQPIERFGFDAAIIFSDILTVVDALGFNLRFEKGHGPVVHNPVRHVSDLSHCSVDEAMTKLQYVPEAIKLSTKALGGRVPLIGFAGSPWTVACYMVQGRNVEQFAEIRKMAYRDPALLHQLLDLLSALTIPYLNSQIEAGAEIIMLFDSWGGLLSPGQYHEFSLQYMQKIAAGLHRQYRDQRVPIIFFTKGGFTYLPQLAQSSCDAIGLDWTVDLAAARALLPQRFAIQGALDPLALYAPPDMIRREVKRLMEAYGPGPGFIFNLGHGIDKDTPVDHVYALVEAVREFGRRD